jgi:hypothetical protein
MINYVVALYVGKRGNGAVSSLTKDPTYMAKRHLHLLSSLRIPLIKKATFVISPSSHEEDLRTLEFVQQNKIGHQIEIDAFIGQNNNNHSYGSWNFAMNKHINDGMHFFLIEDDYFPSRDEFYLPFIEKMNDDVAYVSQLYTSNREHRKHAAISNGLMNYEPVKKHHETFGNSISIEIPGKRPYDVGVYTQLNFLKGYDSIGYRMADVSKNYCHPFLQRNNKITLYGNIKGETLIEPIFYEDKIRNTYSVSSM